jgi:hypothetical protein
MRLTGNLAYLPKNRHRNPESIDFGMITLNDQKEEEPLEDQLQDTSADKQISSIPLRYRAVK